MNLQPTYQRQMSTAKAQASHTGRCCVSGSMGWLANWGAVFGLYGPLSKEEVPVARVKCVSG